MVYKGVGVLCMLMGSMVLDFPKIQALNRVPIALKTEIIRMCFIYVYTNIISFGFAYF